MWGRVVSFFRKYWREALYVFAGLAAFGVIGLAASYSYRHIYEAAEQRYPREQYQPARDAELPPAVKDQPTPNAYQPNCKQPQNKDDADLCAQWAAVQAVGETNRLTGVALRLAYVGFWVALLGGVLGVVTTAFLIKTFRANKAAADAAHDANRPWIEMEVRHGVAVLREGRLEMIVDISVVNRGNSPATNVMPLVTTAFNTPGLFTGGRKTHQLLLERFEDLKHAETNYGTGLFPDRDELWTDLRAIWMPDKIAEATEERGGPPLPFIIAGVRYRFAGKTYFTIETFSVALPDAVRSLKEPFGLHRDQVRLGRHKTTHLT